MKSLKITLLVWLLFGFSSSAQSQNLETVKVYYDYAKTRIKETYSVKRNSGIKQGIYKFYDQDRMLLLEIPYVNNMKNGIAKSYITAGSASFERKPMFYYGKLEHIMTYKNDELDGSYKTYNYDTGKQILKFDRIWSKGELIKDSEYYDNGITKELKQKNGVCNMWYQTGEKMFEYSNVNNVNVGLHTEWFKNGKINVQGSYNDKGKEQGIWKQFDENGMLTETIYENGVDVEKIKAKKIEEQKFESVKFEKAKLELEEKIKDKELKRISEIKAIENQKESELYRIIGNYKIENQLVTTHYQYWNENQYSYKKPTIFKNYQIVTNYILENLNNGITDFDNKIEIAKFIFDLSIKMDLFLNSDTSKLEKELQKTTDIERIIELFKL